MTIKEFHVGQTVFLMGERRGLKTQYTTTQATVAKVGRKYVTINDAWGRQFGETSDHRPYLREHKDNGTPLMLFHSQEAVDTYIEHEELKKWVREAADWSKIDRYSLEQLREVKRILEQSAKVTK